jgi:hypothetical protein
MQIMRRRHGRMAASVAVMVVAVGSVFGVAPGKRAPEHADAVAQTPDLFLFPATANLVVGQADVSVVQTAGVVPVGPGLGGFDITYTYDATAIDLSTSPGPMLGSTGRAVSCGQSNRTSTQLRLACTSTGGAPGATGSGGLVFLTAHLKPGIVMPANGATQLVVIDTAPTTSSLFDVQGAAMPLQRTADVLVTIRALEGDVTGDCVVDIFDEQAILGRLGVSPSSPLYAAAYDVAPSSPDGRIDAADREFVTERLGSTCADAQPAQPPLTVNPDDADDDEVPTTIDNCPLAYNPDQRNTDANNGQLNRPGGDAFGDACDSDISGDGYGNVKKSALGKDLETYCSIMRADVDGDGSVSILDLSKVATAFGKTVPPAPARYQQTTATTISILDLSKMASQFGKPVALCP